MSSIYKLYPSEQSIPVILFHLSSFLYQFIHCKSPLNHPIKSYCMSIEYLYYYKIMYVRVIAIIAVFVITDVDTINQKTNGFFFQCFNELLKGYILEKRCPRVIKI